MARKSNPSLGAHADAIENMARDVAREHSISLSEARSRVRAELQRARDRALSTTAVEGRRRPNPIPLEPPPHVAHDLAKLSDQSLRANHDRALQQIHTGAPSKRDASNRLVCWSLWEARRRGLQFDRSPAAAAPAARASNPVAGNYDFVDDDGKMAPMHPRSQNPYHYSRIDHEIIDEIIDLGARINADGRSWTLPTTAGNLRLAVHGDALFTMFDHPDRAVKILGPGSSSPFGANESSGKYNMQSVEPGEDARTKVRRFLSRVLLPAPHAGARHENPHGHYIDVVLGDGDTVFVDGVPIAHVGDGSAYASDQSDAGFVLHLKHHGRHYAGQAIYGLRPMQIRLVTHPHPSRRVLGMPHPGHRAENPACGCRQANPRMGECGCDLCRRAAHSNKGWCRICGDAVPPGQLICGHHSSSPGSEGFCPGDGEDYERMAREVEEGELDQFHARHPAPREDNPITNQGARSKYGVSADELIKQTKDLYEEAYRADPVYTEEQTERIVGRSVFVWDSLTFEQLEALRQALYLVRLSNPVGTRNSAMGTRVTRTRHMNENGEYDVRHWVRGEMVGDYATPVQEDAVAVQRYLTGEHHGHPRPDIEKFLGERQGPMPCRDDGRFCGGKKASSKRKSNPTTPQVKTDWNQTKLSDGDKAFVRYIMGNVHVGTTEEDVVREWAKRKNLRDHLDTPLAHALINQALDAHWENILVYESVTSMRKLPRVRPSKGQPLPGLPPVRKQAKAAAKPKTRALPASKAPPMLPPAPHDRGDNPIAHWKY